jgi:hypothetical protein
VANATRLAIFSRQSPRCGCRLPHAEPSGPTEKTRIHRTHQTFSDANQTLRNPACFALAGFHSADSAGVCMAACGTKRTFRRSSGPKADIRNRRAECLLMTQSGHSPRRYCAQAVIATGSHQKGDCCCPFRRQALYAPPFSLPGSKAKSFQRGE